MPGWVSISNGELVLLLTGIEILYNDRVFGDTD